MKKDPRKNKDGLKTHQSGNALDFFLNKFFFLILPLSAFIGG